ncbi:MAG: PQQ-dependent sugar dehydrogenase [Anaerolineae bacterium]
MRSKWVPIWVLSLALLIGLGACNFDNAAEPTAPATTIAGEATAAPPSATPTAIPPSETPTATPIPDTPTANPPENTPTAIPPSNTPVSETPSVAPSDTAIPTDTPVPVPSATPTPISGPGDPASVRIELEQITSGLDTPVGIAHAGDGSGRLFVIEKPGRIRVLQDGQLTDTPFLDISERVSASQSERGLLGLAFHPDYASNGFFYVNYTDLRGDTTVSRFAVGSDPGRADPASETVLLVVAQPAANHNGGHLAFGPDGYLYIGTGDGGGAGDRYGNGQNPQTLLGAMLRIDVDGGSPYAVPADNPFVGSPGVRDEIWSIGLRNPWRYSFDRLTGDLYIADVGQNIYEEVNVQPAGSSSGQNYGWPIMEGLHCYPDGSDCDPAGLTLPVAEYNHAQGCSVTGGYVYRGQAFPALSGIYLYGDYCSGRIWGLVRSGDGAWQNAELGQADARISSFGQDESGELYLTDIAGGTLFRIIGQER